MFGWRKKKTSKRGLLFMIEMAEKKRQLFNVLWSNYKAWKNSRPLHDSVSQDSLMVSKNKIDNSAKGYVIKINKSPSLLKHVYTDNMMTRTSVNEHSYASRATIDRKSSGPNDGGKDKERCNTTLDSSHTQEEESTETQRHRCEEMKFHSDIIADNKQVQRFAQLEIQSRNKVSKNRTALGPNGHTTKIQIPNFPPHEALTNVTLEQLVEDMKNNTPAPYVLSIQQDEIEILEHYSIECKTSVKLAIKIDLTLRAKIHVHRKKVPDDHCIWSGFPPLYNSYTNVLLLLKKLQKFSVCIGNPDESFQELCCKRSYKKYGYKEGDFCAQIKGTEYHSTIRSVKCSLLVQGQRCRHCSFHRRCLGSRKRCLDKKLNRNAALVCSNHKHRDMSKDLLILKINRQRNRKQFLQRKIIRLQKEVKKATPVIPPENNVTQMYSCVSFPQVINIKCYE